MAKTVAEIDGDSSGLVSALDKGRDGMVKMEASGKKLSDQLREVTDKADQAAGAIVEKIGGPKAIAALGGAGIALGGAKMAADFFLNSVEKLFKSMGDEGMKVWDDVEKALDAVSGAFAKAVLGGGSAEDMGKKLIAVFNGLATIVESLVTYGFPMLRIAFEGIIIAMTTLNEWTTKDKEAFDDLKRAQDNYASATSISNIQNLTTAYANLSTKIQGMVGDQAALGLAANDAAQAELRSMQASFKNVGNVIRDVEIRKQVEKSRAVLLARVTREVANMDFTYAGMGWKIERDREITERLATATGDLYSSISRQFAEQKKDAYSFMPAALQAQYDDAEASLSMLEEKWDMLYEQYLGKDVKPAPKTGGGGPPKSAPGAAVVGEFEAKEKAARDARMAEYFKEDDDLKKTIESSYETFGIGVTRILFGTGDMATSFGILGEEVRSIWNGVVDDTVAGLGTVETATKATEEAHSAFYDKWVAGQAKMIGTAIGNGEKMADIGRKAIGSIISALGDEMLARASIATFSGNIAGGIGLTAAATAAYAAAAYLGASGKKATTATAATAAAPAVTNNQTNFNLRVDAAFADEESIARSFARAQSFASNRYMTAGYQ
jgi:hypothetical protein